MFIRKAVSFQIELKECLNLEISWKILKGTVAQLLTSRKRPFLVVLIGLIGFAVSVISLTSVHIGNNFTDIPNGAFFFLQVIPFAYWIGIGLLVLSILYVGCLKEQDVSARTIKLGVLLSALLITSMRIVLNVGLTNFLYYDALVDYAPQITSWLHQGISFIPNTYAHDWPFSFIVAYIFTKAGISVNTFFEWAAVPIYFIEAYLVYLIASVILNKKNVVLAVFLFGLISLSSEGGLLTLFYNPQIVGGVFYLLSLYLTLKVLTQKETSRKTLSLLCVSIFLMILSHHLTVIYFILTLLGVLLLSRILPSRFKQFNFKIFGFLTIFTSVSWVTYGIIVYPATFGDWISAFQAIIMSGKYLPGYNQVGVGSLSHLPLFDAISLVAVPLFIVSLFLLQLGRIWRGHAGESNRPSFISGVFSRSVCFVNFRNDLTFGICFCFRNSL